jgi:hypothetical protein
MKKTIKTALLIILGTSALFLAWRIYDGIVFRNRPEAEVYAPARSDFVSASPAKCAVTRDGVRTGAQYDALTETVYEAFKPYLAEAFGKADGGLFFVTEDCEFREELLSDGVYFEFSGTLPLSLIAAWLSSPPLPYHLEIIGLGLVGAGIDADLPELRPCVFAFESDYAEVFHPLQLLFEETGRKTAVISAPPDIGSELSYYAAFLEKLELFPADTPFYTRGNSRVYVDAENGRSCEISSDGAIVFSNQSTAVLPVRSIAEDVLLAWETLALLHPVMGSAVFEVRQVTQTEHGAAVEFLIKAEGVPLLWEPVVVETSHGTVRHISLLLCRVDLEENLALPLSAKQAAALLDANGGNRMGLYYPGAGGVTVWGVRG